MVLNRIIPKVTPMVRQFNTSRLLRSDHDTRNIVGSNLPFQIKNRYRLAFWFFIYVSSGLGLPFYVLRHLIVQKNQS